MDDLRELTGYQVEDNGELTRLDDVISELQEFVHQFSTHAMSDHALFLNGKREAYLEVIEYLKRVSPTELDKG